MEERMAGSVSDVYIKAAWAEKPAMNFEKADVIFAFAAPVCGFLYWDLINLNTLGAGVTVFALIICAASFIYLSKSGFRQNRASSVCLGLIILSAAQFTLFDNLFICLWNFMFLTVAFIYWICLTTGRRLDGRLSVYIIGDALKQGIVMPFMNFGCCFGGIKKGFSKQKKGRGALAAIIGVLIFMPLIAAVINLLMSADSAFESFVGGFFKMVNVENVIIYILEFIGGIPVAFYLYGLIYGDAKGRYAGKITVKSVDNAAKVVRIAPKSAIYSALTVFNIIYLTFFAVQAAYLFSAFNGELPETFTYAEYARRGFFELCTVAGINLGVLALSHVFVKRVSGEEPKVLKVETTLISVFTLLLIATALSKMGMYINEYGLTQLRVFTSWFMVLLAVVFLIICVRQFIKFNAAKSIIICGVVLFMLLSYGNVDGMIAKYNIGRYEAGTLKTLDVEALGQLSDAAVPYMYELYLKADEENDFEMRRRLYEAAGGRLYLTLDEYNEDGFGNFNLQNYRADYLRDKMFGHY